MAHYSGRNVRNLSLVSFFLGTALGNSLHVFGPLISSIILAVTATTSTAVEVAHHGGNVQSKNLHILILTESYVVGIKRLSVRICIFKLFWIPSLKIYKPDTPSSTRIKIENEAYKPDKFTKESFKRR